MSVSTLSYSTDIPPFYQVSGAGKNFSNANSSVTGDVLLASTKDNATGKTATTVSSSVTDNGTSYAEAGAAINGSLLTVNYLSSSAADSIPNSSQAAALTNANINGSGINFNPQSSTATGNSVTTNYATSPNAALDETIQNAATSTGQSDDNQNIVLKSLAVVGNSLTATYELTSGSLPDNTVLAPSQAPPTRAIISVAQPAATPDANSITFSSQGVTTIGDLLANSNGLDNNGSLSGALGAQAGTNTGSVNAASTLSATLDPGIDLSPSTSVQVTDFVNPALNAFPTSNPTPAPNPFAAAANNPAANAANAYTAASNSFDTGNGFDSQRNDNAPDFSPASGAGNSFATFTPTSDATTPAGIYSAIGNANASTIRGTGLDAVA